MFEFQQIKVKAPDRDKIKYVPLFPLQGLHFAH
jgi:hypothetical protein